MKTQSETDHPYIHQVIRTPGDTEPYIRSDDGATMIAMSPGVYAARLK